MYGDPFVDLRDWTCCAIPPGVVDARRAAGRMMACMRVEELGHTCTCPSSAPCQAPSSTSSGGTHRDTVAELSAGRGLLGLLASGRRQCGPRHPRPAAPQRQQPRCPCHHPCRPSCRWTCSAAALQGRAQGHESSGVGHCSCSIGMLWMKLLPASRAPGNSRHASAVYGAKVCARALNAHLVHCE
mgnify:CR=1 FL=1